MRRGQTQALVTGNAVGLSGHFDLVTFLSCDFDCLLKHGPFLLLNAKAVRLNRVQCFLFYFVDYIEKQGPSCISVLDI